MEDQQIIRLLFLRSETAIDELQRKFGGLCRSISGQVGPGTSL